MGECIPLLSFDECHNLPHFPSSSLSLTLSLSLSLYIYIYIYRRKIKTMLIQTLNVEYLFLF